ncbi:Rho-type GTPase activating protein Rga1 [Thecaphora frezii]
MGIVDDAARPASAEPSSPNSTGPSDRVLAPGASARPSDGLSSDDPSAFPSSSTPMLPGAFASHSRASSRERAAGSRSHSPVPGSELGLSQSRADLSPSPSLSVPGEGPEGKGRRRADMDRIKSRAVDPGWSWEQEKEKQEASLAGSEHGPGPHLPRRASSRPLPRINTGSQGAAQNSSSSSSSVNGSGHLPARKGSHSALPSPEGGLLPGSNIALAQSSAAKADAGQVSIGGEGAEAASGAHPNGSSSGSSFSNSQPPSTRDKAPSGRKEQACRACGKTMTGQFVRALGSVYHLDCFRCNDCNKVVAAKFFPATDDMVDSAGTGKLFPLCETDYFRRLDLICAKCGGALRGSYITALGKKFHVEHFTCSVCPTVFGPQDSYYEHDGQVFCHFHYSTRFAIKCTGCKTAILKQFVEINRNNRDEHWHPECYMIHKFWNIKLCPTGSTPREGVANEPTAVPSAPEPSNSGVAPTLALAADAHPTADALEIEAKETPSTLKQKQKQMEERVYRIWTVLSAFEESSAACISEMLRHVSSGRYLGGVRMAERFILHVEVLFSAIDDLEAHFRREEAKGISHIREARMLCKKIVNFFSLLSHTQETGARRMGITQELLSLVTGLAHYLKILIRIALTGALKLDREYGNDGALSWFLSQLAFSAKLGASQNDDQQFASIDTNAVSPDGKWYGYRSLPRSTSSGSSETGETATDLCVACGQTVEEECLRMGVNLRWHSNCLKCRKCKRPAIREGISTKKLPEPDAGAPEPLPASQFGLETVKRSLQEANSSRAPAASQMLVHTCYCPTCMTGLQVRTGFESVTRLEQYAFLLRVALNRLFALLRKRGVVPPSPPVAPTTLQDASQKEPAAQSSDDGVSMHEAYRDSQDIKRMKSVNLDRKLSTKAKVPRISTIVGSPSGRQTQTSDMQRPSPTDMISQQLESRQSPRSPSPGSSRGERSSPRPQLSSREPSPSGRDPKLYQPTASSQQQQQQQQQSQQYRGRTTASQPLGQQQQQQQPLPKQSLQRGLSPAAPEPGSIVPIRPPFARHNTDVRIREDGPIRQPSGDEMHKSAPSEDGITLADIPQILEAEQAREQHRALPNEGTRTISELSALELFIVKHMAVMMLQQSALKDMVNLDDLIEFIETRKNTFWGKFFKGGKDKKEIKKKGVFGIPLEILVERNGADSTLGASAAHLRVPSFIDDIISAMKQMDLSVEGIFRKNGNIRRLKELSEALDRDSSAVNLLDDNPVQLAALLKKFLRELPDPLMTFKLHKLFVMSQKLEPEAERRRILHMVTVLLPKSHRDTMEVLFAFLKWVASFSHIDEETGSKMDLPNLATVICPNILYSKGTDPTKDETFLANRAVSYLLEHQDDFWTVPEELEAVLYDRELLSASADLTSRDILKKCEKYARRQRAPGGRGGGGGGGPLHAGEMTNRHRPDMHPPTTMRQIQMESNNYRNNQQQQFSNANAYSRSPDSGGPWSAGSSGAQNVPSPTDRLPPSNHATPQKVVIAANYGGQAPRTPTQPNGPGMPPPQQQQQQQTPQSFHNPHHHPHSQSQQPPPHAYYSRSGTPSSQAEGSERNRTVAVEQRTN